MDNSAPKKRRIDAVVSQPPPPSSSSAATVQKEVGLPPELWANILQYNDFYEVLKLTCTNKFFLHDVTKQIKILYIRSGESMDVLPAAIERFVNVKSVIIHLIRELVHGVADFHLDVLAMQMIVPFLSRLPSLQLCRLGGKRTGEFGRDINIEYDVDNAEQLYDHPHPHAKWAAMIASVCRAFKTGKLSENVSFDGLILNIGCEDHCAWKDLAKLDEYRDDVKCQVCDMICNSFPPLRVLEMNYESIPCIEIKNMAKIVRFRDEDNSKSIMTAAIISELGNVDHQSYMCPPDYCTNTCYAMTFYDNHFERLESFISNGGDPNDAAVIAELLEKRNPCYTFVGNRKIIEKESYDTMKGLGFKLTEDDFCVLDQDDIRTSINHFKVRKAKNQLSSGVAICDIKDICDKIKHISCGGFTIFKGRRTECNHLTLENVINILTKWLEVDLSDHKESIEKLISEYRKGGNTSINTYKVL